MQLLMGLDVAKQNALILSNLTPSRDDSSQGVTLLECVCVCVPMYVYTYTYL